MRNKTVLWTALAMLLTTASAWAYTWDGFDFHGFLDQGYIATDKNNFLANSKDGTFHLTDAAFNVRRQINDKLSVGAQVFTYRDGDFGALNRPMIDWAYVDYRWQDWLGVRAGKVKASVGLYGDTLDLQMTRPFVFLPMSNYNPLYREIENAVWGGSVYGDVPVHKFGSLDYSIEVGMLGIGDEGGAAESTMQSLPFNTDHSSNNYCVNEQVIWNTPYKGLKLEEICVYVNRIDGTGLFKDQAELAELIPPLNGLAAYAPLFTGANSRLQLTDTWNATLGAEYQVDKWTFAAEYMRQWQDLSTSVNSPYATTFGLDTNKGTISDGFYLSAVRQITSKLDLGAYYCLSFSNVRDRTGATLAATGDQSYHGFSKDLALSACYKIKPWWLVKAEGHVINGTSYLVNVTDNQPWSDTSRYWLMGVLQTTLFF